MYIAYTGERPEMIPLTELPVRTRPIWISKIATIEEVYNVAFLRDGVAYDYPFTGWSCLGYTPDNGVVFCNHKYELTMPLPDRAITCEDCGSELEGELRLNEDLRYCPRCDSPDLIKESFGKRVPVDPDEVFPFIVHAEPPF